LEEARSHLLVQQIQQQAEDQSGEKPSWWKR
jgi:hypothetical protein